MDKIKKMLEQRKVLLNEAQNLVAEGKYEEFAAKEEEIKGLDNQIEAAKLAYTNLQALQENNTMGDLSNLSTFVDGEPMASFSPNVLTTDAVYENAFAKTMMGVELTKQENAVFMEMNNHTTTNASVVIPKTTLNEVITDIEAQNPFYADVRKLEIKGNVSLPLHKAITSGDAKAYLELEETELEENEFDDVQLGAKEISKYIEVSFKLEAMSVPAFLAYLKEELVERLGAELGRQVINGNGVKEMKGVLPAMAGVSSQNSTYVAADGLKYKDITGAIAKLGAKHVANAAIYASNSTVWNVIANVLDETGKPLFVGNTVTDKGVGRVLSLPVKVDSGVPEGTIIIGNAKGYSLNENQAIGVETERNLKKRKTGFSGYTLQDGNVTNEKAFSILTPQA